MIWIWRETDTDTNMGVVGDGPLHYTRVKMYNNMYSKAGIFFKVIYWLPGTLYFIHYLLWKITLLTWALKKAHTDHLQNQHYYLYSMSFHFLSFVCLFCFGPKRHCLLCCFCENNIVCWFFSQNCISCCVVSIQNGTVCCVILIVKIGIACVVFSQKPPALSWPVPGSWSVQYHCSSLHQSKQPHKQVTCTHVVRGFLSF